MAGSGLPSSVAYSKTEPRIELGLSASSVQCEFDDNSSGCEQSANILFYFVQKANLIITFLTSHLCTLSPLLLVDQSSDSQIGWEMEEKQVLLSLRRTARFGKYKHRRLTYTLFQIKNEECFQYKCVSHNIYLETLPPANTWEHLETFSCLGGDVVGLECHWVEAMASGKHHPLHRTPPSNGE